MRAHRAESPLICTLDPPKAVAAMASNIPVNARIFFLRQNRRNDSEYNRRHDEALDQNAHRLHRIMRAQFGRAQQLRKMQAQDSSERKKSEERRQYPAPPAGPKAGSLGIAKEFIHLLLDHDGP